MPRISAPLFMRWASCGKCSLIWTPGTLVLMARYGPPCGVPGLRSKVSLWLGPPSIHSTMHFLACWLFWAARLARIGSQPDSEAPPTPRADSFTKSRRDRPRPGILSCMVLSLLGGTVFVGKNFGLP